MVLKTCVGRLCTHPWETLFPNGEVNDLLDAADSTYDDFFESKVERVAFEKCERGYIAESEGPVWDGSQAYGMVHEMSFEL
jgi:N-acetylglucosamine-6-sulfatase